MEKRKYPSDGIVFLIVESPQNENIRSFITSFMYGNAILGDLTGATCISLIFLSPSASCTAELMPWPAAELELKNRHNKLPKEFLKISFLACLGHAGWPGGNNYRSQSPSGGLEKLQGEGKLPWLHL